jgi:hypothetical protein
LFILVKETLHSPPSPHKSSHTHKGAGTDEETLIEIIASRSNAELSEISTMYERMYKTDLERDIDVETKGNITRVLLALLSGLRPEAQIVDQQRAAADARALYEAGQKHWAMDDSVFDRVLLTSSPTQLAGRWWSVFARGASITGLGS